MINEFSVRPAVVSDAPIIAEFQQAMAHETEGRGLDPRVLASGVRAVFDDPNRGMYYVAQRDAAIIGGLLVTYEWSDWRDGVFWWIQSVFVRVDSRGLGVYSALHRHVENLARNTPGVCGLRLYVDNENAHAQRVYSKLGMTASNYTLYETDWRLHTRPEGQC